MPLVADFRKDQKDIKDDNYPNILLLGIDSVSRLNFERHFPLTKKIIAQNNFYTMYGYNKVGENTFPNLIPLLTGFYAEDIWNKSTYNDFDDFPFIWKVSSSEKCFIKGFVIV